MANNKVFLFIPNIIGYFRVFFYLGSFLFHVFDNWLLCIIFYSIGFILDEFDGRFARLLNQNSNFGAALDMVIDRCATAGLCLLLAQLYPNYTLAFILLIALDISSHYYLLYATGMLGKSSHKDSEDWSEHRLMQLYYGNKPFMDLLIAGNELFYIFLYIAYYAVGYQLSWFNWNISLWQVALLICLPFYLLKQITNLLQLQSSVKKITSMDLANSKEKSSIELRAQNPQLRTDKN
jgi:CDP-diacylglycerol--inositol 3-phosphatidyltransferase